MTLVLGDIQNHYGLIALPLSLKAICAPWEQQKYGDSH